MTEHYRNYGKAEGRIFTTDPDFSPSILTLIGGQAAPGVYDLG